MSVKILVCILMRENSLSESELSDNVSKSLPLQMFSIFSFPEVKLFSILDAALFNSTYSKLENSSLSPDVVL